MLTTHVDDEDFNFGQVTPDFSTILGDNAISDLLNGAAAYCLAAIAGFDIQPAENLYVVVSCHIKPTLNVRYIPGADWL
jgi:hypothetical protein